MKMVTETESIEPVEMEDFVGIDQSDCVMDGEPRIKTLKRDNQQSSETPEEEALRNSLILETIMSYSMPDHLKRNRLVNKTWCKAASLMALKRDIFQVRLKCHNNFDSFNHDRGAKKLNGLLSSVSLESLNNCLEKSVLFPASNFHFDQGNLASVDVQEFFDIFGFNIKNLSLKSTMSVTSKETLLKILTKQAPHVETLRIEGFDFTWDSNEIPISSLNFLKTVELPVGPVQQFPQDTISTTEVILHSAYNLQAITGFSPLQANLLAKSNKLHLVKSLQRFNVFWPTNWNIDSTTKFMNAQPQLYSLQVAMPERGFGTSHQELINIFMGILTSSKISLKELELGELLYPAYFNNKPVNGNHYFPKMINLKKLILKEPNGSGGRYLPMGSHLNEKFPHLKTLVFVPCYNWDKHYLFLEEFSGPGLSSVQNLEIHDNFSENCLKQLQDKLCPNFKRLKVNELCRIDLFLPVIYKVWPHIENLTIMVDNLQKNNLDVAFTGFSKEDCRRLYLESSKTNRISEFEEIQRGPWLGDCKELKSLRINFGNVGSYNRAEPSKPLSFVSGLYGFQLMSNSFQVTIGHDKLAQWSYRMKAALESMSNFSTIVQYSRDQEDGF